MLNKSKKDGLWVVVKMFAIIPRKCYDSKTKKEYIVWLEYINRMYKYETLEGRYEGRYVIHSHGTINE